MPKINGKPPWNRKPPQFCLLGMTLGEILRYFCPVRDLSVGQFRVHVHAWRERTKSSIQTNEVSSQLVKEANT